MSNSFQPHGLQHTRIPRPPLTCGVCSNSRPLHWWCYLTISSDPKDEADVGIRPLLQCLHLPRAGLVLLTLLFLPLVLSSYRVLCGSMYSFPVVRYCCPLSAGVLKALLCLKVYSWCIRGERCPPSPPTPLSSCSSLTISFLLPPSPFAFSLS